MAGALAKLSQNKIHEFNGQVNKQNLILKRHFPFELDAACEPPKVDRAICGNYTQTCQSDGSVTDYEVDFFYADDGQQEKLLDGAARLHARHGLFTTRRRCSQ
jgi:hypothetical protein